MYLTIVSVNINTCFVYFLCVFRHAKRILIKHIFFSFQKVIAVTTFLSLYMLKIDIILKTFKNKENTISNFQDQDLLWIGRLKSLVLWNSDQCDSET